MIYMKRRGVIHRDISVENLMVEADNHQNGVLIDLDIAARVKDGDRILRPVLTHAGTLGFRAIGLLLEGTHYPTRTLYRDELESFYYALLYIQMHYRDGKRLPIHDKTLWWNIARDDVYGLGMRKLGGLNRPIPECPLRDWLLGLQKLFFEALVVQDHHKRREQGLPRVDDETMGGYLTYHNFIQACAL